jgi:hypothetical protein
MECGESGIRTHGTLASTLPFQGSQFSHSCTSPNLVCKYIKYLTNIQIETEFIEVETYLSKIIFSQKDKVIRLRVSGMDNVTKVLGKKGFYVKLHQTLLILYEKH